MAKKLTRTVHLTNPETRRVEVFVKGDTPPGWARELITNEAAFRDDAPEADATAAEPSGDEVPVRSASKGDWKAYAVSQGMAEDEADQHTRDELADLYLGE